MKIWCADAFEFNYYLPKPNKNVKKYVQNVGMSEDALTVFKTYIEKKGTDLFFALFGASLPPRFDTMIDFCFNFVNESIAAG